MRNQRKKTLIQIFTNDTYFTAYPSFKKIEVMSFKFTTTVKNLFAHHSTWLWVCMYWFIINTWPQFISPVLTPPTQTSPCGTGGGGGVNVTKYNIWKVWTNRHGNWSKLRCLIFCNCIFLSKKERKSHLPLKTWQYWKYYNAQSCTVIPWTTANNFLFIL